MKKALWVIVLVGACGGAQAPATAPLVDPGVTAPPQPAASRDALLAAVFGALARGDIATLRGISNLGPAMECTSGPPWEERDEHYPRVAGKTRGLALEVTGVAGDQLTAVSAPGELVTDGCTAKVAIELHELTLEVRIAAPGRPARTAGARVEAIRAGEGWYLQEVPRIELSDPAPRIQQLRTFESRLCACRDRACFDKAYAEATEWSRADFFRTRDELRSDDVAKIGDAIGVEIEKCKAHVTTMR